MGEERVRTGRRYRQTVRRSAQGDRMVVLGRERKRGRQSKVRRTEQPLCRLKDTLHMEGKRCVVAAEGGCA